MTRSRTDRRIPADVQKAIETIRNPGGGMRLVSHGFVKRPQRLSGSMVLSTGRSIPVRVELDVPDGLSAEEKAEIRSAHLALHDLTPG